MPLRHVTRDIIDPAAGYMCVTSSMDAGVKPATFIFISLSLQSIVQGQLMFGVAPFRQPNGRQCAMNRDCDFFSDDPGERGRGGGGGGGGGEICYKLYDGCSLGHCMCDPRTHALDAYTGKCAPVRRLNEACDTSDTCSGVLLCISGTCRCPYGLGPSTSVCLHPTHKPLGQRCSPSGDTCYHESAYGGRSYSEVECSPKHGGVCQCKEGYVRERATCRKLRIWEMGCGRDFYCEGGAVCVDGQCACPTGYNSVARNTKCAKTGATVDLPLRKVCDEIHERRYCAHGLVCHKCQDADASRICVRYLPGLEADHSALTNGAHLSTTLPLVLAVVQCIPGLLDAALQR